MTTINGTDYGPGNFGVYLPRPGDSTTLVVSVINSLGNQDVLTIWFYREDDGGLSYDIREHSDDDAPGISNILPEFFSV